jgi:hypothetical protein
VIGAIIYDVLAGVHPPFYSLMSITGIHVFVLFTSLPCVLSSPHILKCCRAKLSTVLPLGFGVQIYRRLGLGLPKHQPMAAH